MKKLILLAIVLFLCLNLDFQKFSNKPSLGCAFCDPKILETQTFYEGNGARALLTYKPAVNGHVLIIPNRHVERFEELTSEEVMAIGQVIQKVDAAVKKTFGHKDYVLVQKNGKGAGQSVPHVHFHYIPAAKFYVIRFFLIPWFKPLSAEKLKVLKDTLSAAIGTSPQKTVSLNGCSI